MENTITSREAILEACKEIAMSKGLQGINMRTVAKKANISVGSIYNYFPSKTDLVIGTVESIWVEIFNIKGHGENLSSFTDTLHWLFKGLSAGVEKYPGFFTYHALSFAEKDKAEGKEAMDKYFNHITKGLLTSLKADKKIRKDAFNEEFTPEGFVDVLLSLFMSNALKGDFDDSYILEIVKRSIY